MKGYFNRIVIYIIAGVVLTGVLWMINSGTIVDQSEGVAYQDQVQLLYPPLNLKDGNTAIKGKKSVLVLYSEGDTLSEKLMGNLEQTCRWMKMDVTSLSTAQKENVSYLEYDVVVIATSHAETELGTDLSRIMHYVEAGGSLFWAIMPDTVEGNIGAIYRQLGIMGIGAYTEIDGYTFVEELIPGSKGMQFSDPGFLDVAVSYQLENTCKVYMESIDSKIPLVWSFQFGEGKSLFCNMTAPTGDFYTGLLGGCLLALQDVFMYPVINAKVVFIDDFPSMQYNSESKVIKAEYNRTVKEFYRDIWWPGMQSAANRYNLKYTGVFMATYNDIVDPKQFVYERDEMEQYYGKSLLKNGFEMGAHGYNHMSLTLEGGTPEEMGYNAWASIRDMSSSLEKLLEITEYLFENVKIQTYVPPSNYLSEEGRMAVVDSLKDLKIISGVYTNEDEAGEIYVQEFEIAGDGIAEFPRMTSGMLDSGYEDFIMIGATGLYGVFSHFIHPDDILDSERGAGLTWQTLLDNFCEKLNKVNTHYKNMRALTASDAADALQIAYYAEVSYEVTDDKIIGEVYDYYGEGYFYLKTEKKPGAASDGCTITRLNDLYEGDVYLVHLTEPEFVITLQ